MISEFLETGEANAITASELCQILHTDKRTLTAAIERERRAGSAICAGGRGYYLAASQDEMARYCRSLERRIKEVTITKDACILTMERSFKNGQSKKFRESD